MAIAQFANGKSCWPHRLAWPRRGVNAPGRLSRRRLPRMLIWLNGAFGVGKTQTAHELQRRLGDAHVADPELLGFAMHKMLPAAARGDFQNLPEWRAGVVATLLRPPGSQAWRK
jgi:hypothetical protein